MRKLTFSKDGKITGLLTLTSILILLSPKLYADAIIAPGVLNDITIYNTLTVPHVDIPGPADFIEVGTSRNWWRDLNGNEEVDPGEITLVEGNGTVSQSSGIINSLYYTHIGKYGFTGTYNLSGGTLIQDGLPSGTSGTGQGVTYVGSEGGTGFFNQTGGVHQAYYLYLGLNFGSSGTYTLSGGQLFTQSTSVGSNGVGEFLHTGGTHDITYDLRIRDDYIMSGTAQLSVGHNMEIGYASGLFHQTANTLTVVDNDLDIGFGGDGTFRLDAGALEVNDDLHLDRGYFLQNVGATSVTVLDKLYIGRAGGAQGQYDLLGGILNVGECTTCTSSNDSLIVGTYGDGEFNQTGVGTEVNIASELQLGISTGQGIYNLQAGSLTVGDDVKVGDYFGNGIFNHTGGSNTVLHDLYVGHVGTGTYDLSGVNSTLDIRDDLIVGKDDIGHFYQSEGIVVVDDVLYMGDNPGGSGFYELSGGELRTDSEQLGDEGFGRFDQSGGSHLVTNSMAIGQQDDGEGVYYLDDGYLFIGGTLYLGDDSANTSGLFVQNGGILETLDEQIGDEGYGRFEQRGGIHTVEDILIVGDEATGRGFYEMYTGADLQTFDATIGKRGEGTFTQNAADVRVENELHLGEFTGGDGQYVLLDGNLNVKRHPLNIAPLSESEIIGVKGSGLFRQEGGTHIVANELILGQFLSGDGEYQLNGGVLEAGSQVIGDAGAGRFFHVGGANTVLGDLAMGFATSGDGHYELSGTGELVATNEIVGVSGLATFIQTGGVNKFANRLTLGQSIGSTGNYELHAGSLGILHLNTEVIIGEAGIGNFLQTGGVFNVPGPMTLGHDASGDGDYILVAGDLNTTSEVIGRSGKGSFLQQGGSHLVSDSMFIGLELNSEGLYQLESGLLESNNLYIGDRGFGEFIQTDGTHDVGFELVLAQESDGLGSFDMSGGTLESHFLRIGERGTGEFMQNGGSTSINFALSMGSINPGASGSFDLIDGDLIADDEYIGEHGMGLFTQSGGTNTAVNSFTLGRWLTGEGAYTLNGGDLISRSTIIGNQGKGDFIQRGGRHIIANDLYLSRVLGGRSTYLLEDGELQAKNETIAHSGEAQFTQTGGTNTVEETLTIVKNGAIVGQYNLDGGSLKADTIDTSSGGIFNFTDGLLSVETFIGDLVNNGGILAPGNSPGATSILGDFTQGPGGTLNIDIGGFLPGIEHDVLNISGTAYLGGTLDIELYGAFSPLETDSFDILVADSIIGDFDILLFDIPGAGLAWEINTISNAGGSDILRLSVVTSPVPLPATFWLSGSILPVLLFSRRKKQVLS